MKQIGVVILLLAGILSASAQRMRTPQKSTASKTAVTSPIKPRPAKKTEKALRPKLLLPDTVYSVETAKQHGWYSPLTIITKEVARHRGAAFRFTNRNPRGRWLKMETVDGRGRLVGGQVSPYIVDLASSNSDKAANKEWVDKLNTTCTFEFIPDPTGREIVQERAYDKEGNLVYLYTRTPIGANKEGRKQYIGRYNDIYGLPAEMRNDTTFTYTFGTLVMLTEDRWGNDSIIEYMDACGVKKPNDDGVALRVSVCDKQGYLLRKEYRDAQGNLAVGKWGYCGLEYERRNGSSEFIRYIVQPTVSDGGEMDSDDNVIYGNRIEYDQYHRMKSIQYTDRYGLAVLNEGGVSKMAYRYNDYGEIIEQSYHDIDGKLCDYKDGYAIIKCKFDSDGNIILQERFDAAGRPALNSQLISREEKEYDDSGRLKNLKQYTVENDSLKLIYNEVNTPTTSLRTYEDGTKEVHSYDEKGRLEKIAFYDANMNLMDKYGVAIMSIRREDLTHKTIGVIESFDKEHRPVDLNDKIVKTIQNIDSIARTCHEIGIASSGDVISSRVLKYADRNFETLDSLDIRDINKYGVEARTGRSETGRAYLVKKMINQRGYSVASVPRDEFDESDYCVINDMPYCQMRIRNYYDREKYYDENNSPIENETILKDALPKTFSIEVTDSAAYRLGLKDNDLIIADGDYVNIPTRDVKIDDFIGKRFLSHLENTNSSRRMVVFRVNPETKEYGLVAIDSINGNDFQNGFIAHVRYLTDKQRQRVEDCCRESDLLTENQISSGYLPIAVDSDKSIAIVGTDRYEKEERGNAWGEPNDYNIILSACVPDLGLKWNSNDSISKLWDLSTEILKCRVPPEIIYYIVNPNLKIEQVIVPKGEWNGGVQKVSVPDSIYHRYDSLALTVCKAIDNDYNKSLIRLPKGKYKMETADSEFNTNLEVSVDNKGNITLSGGFKSSVWDGVNFYDLKVNINSGKELVGMHGNSIFLKDFVTYECIGITPEDSSQMQPDDAVKQVNIRISQDESFRNFIDRNLYWPTSGMSRRVILCLKDGSYALEDESGNVVRLQRVGKK